MRADNTHHVVDSARRRAELTRERAVAALGRLDATGQPVGFDAVAREAGVSRSWLYTQPDLRAEIDRLRARGLRGSAPKLPAAQRASDASLLRRLEAATDRIARLEAQNAELREQLARALGDRRAM